MEDEEEGYTALHFKKRKKRSNIDSSPKCPGLWYLVLIFGLLSLLLLGAVITLSLQRDLQSTKSLWPKENHNTSEEDPYARILLIGLKDSLCIDTKESKCELCPSGWVLHSGRCYYYSEDCETWNYSKEFCSEKKSELLVIEDETEMF